MFLKLSAPKQETMQTFIWKNITYFSIPFCKRKTNSVFTEFLFQDIILCFNGSALDLTSLCSYGMGNTE